MNNKAIDSSKLSEKSKEIIKHAKKWIKKEAYFYVFNFENSYGNFLQYLINETDARSNIEYYFIDSMLNTYIDEKNSVLSELLFFTDTTLQYAALYEDYLERTVTTILNIPEFEIYHKDVKTLYDNFIELNKEYENMNDIDKSSLITSEILRKNTSIVEE